MEQTGAVLDKRIAEETRAWAWLTALGLHVQSARRRRLERSGLRRAIGDRDGGR